jgi:two-component system NtrC family sensor kinase
MVTDARRRVVVWNQAAERLYGIAATDAIGVTIETLYDSTMVGDGRSSAHARDVTLERGSWRGRVVDVPHLGSRAGHEVIVEAVLDRLDGPDGEPVGVISVKRDITSSVRLERELSGLGSLATATGEARSRATLAQRALDVVATTTGADHGAIVVAHGRAGRIIAANDLPAILEHIAADVDWAEAPIVRAVRPSGRVVKGQVDRLPLDPGRRREMLDAGLRWLLLVGLHRDDELIGLLSLAWDRDDAVLPSDAAIQLVATTVARGLENARLVEEIVRRAEAARETADRLQRIDELARVGASVPTLAHLAERSGRIVNQALGAAGTAYEILAADGGSSDTSSITAGRPMVDRWLHEHRPDLGPALRRWRTGEAAYLEAFESGVAPAPYLELGREAGIKSYAAMPIRIGDTVVGGITSYFDRPIGDVHLDRRDLDRVASIASMALENFRMRERLLGSEQRYRTLFEGSRDPMLVALVEGTIVDANEAALRLFGSEREWLLGRRPVDLADFDTEDVAARAARLRLGESFVSRATGIRRDGSHFPEEVEIASVMLDGEPRLVARLRDLTAQERLQAELVRAQKMEATGHLVSGVAHELNNPLASILGFSQLIRRDPSLPDDLRNNADLLVEEAARTQRIVQNLLDFVRQRPPERHPTSVRALVDSVLTLQSYSLSRGEIDLEVDIPDDLPPVELDRGQIQLVLVNLTHNAIYAIRDGSGSRLSIRANRQGRLGDERVRITVTDDGSGVAPEHVDHLFEPFFTTKPPADGTGLGLPVSHGIVRSHGGELRFVPPASGRGAAFTFDLPVHAAPADASLVPPLPGPATTAPTSVVRPPAGAARANTRLRVLVLDDEPSLRIFLEKALTALGFEPVITAIGAEAVTRAADGDHAVLLLDHQMPGMSGTEAYESIVALRPDLAARAVMMSGDVLDAGLVAFAATHPVTLLAKPFDLDTLERTIRDVIEATAQSRG